MTTRQALRLTHVVSTIWFVACIGYILVLELHRAGFHWWLIFSLSSHSALVVLLLISLYLFALFRGVGEAQQIEVEHPLTTTSYYMAFYVAAPLLGGLAGTLGMVGDPHLVKFFLGVAMGALGTTFVVWVIVDPIAGLAEMFLPASRKHRLERFAQVEAQRRTRQEKREQLLAEAFAREEQERQRWQQHLHPRAERLAALLACNVADLSRAEREAVDIGANAWRLGGLSCMRQLRDMTVAIRKDAGDDATVADHISNWWDGIGDWRRPSLP
jgi:signal transduction histidine kinase